MSPTYFWGLPSIVGEFLGTASFKTGYLFFIATYGTLPGAAGVMAARAIRGREIDAYYSVRMPDTWTPVFDLSTPEKTARFTGTTEADICRAIRGVSERRTNRHMFPRTPAFITELISQPMYNNSARRTANLRVGDDCVGCGLSGVSALVNRYYKYIEYYSIYIRDCKYSIFTNIYLKSRPESC